MKVKTAGFNWGRLLFWATTAVGVLAVLISVSIIIAGIIAVVQPFKQDCVGLIKVEGELTTDGGGGGIFAPGVLSSDDYAALIEEAGKRGEVKAVLVEINSPGGSVVASREIYESVKELKKPKVAYFREMAASGGYYAAAGTDYIISDPDAITGSIGARATFVDMSGLFEKIGYNQTVVKSGKHKDMGDPGRPMTGEEINITQGIVNEVFAEFVRAVEEGRGGRLNRSRFSEVLDARIMTGRQAKEVGLVDEVGNRKAALRKAAALANMSYEGDVPPVCEIGGNRGVWDGMFGSAAAAFGNALRSALYGGSEPGMRVEY